MDIKIVYGELFLLASFGQDIINTVRLVVFLLLKESKTSVILKVIKM